MSHWGVKKVADDDMACFAIASWVLLNICSGGVCVFIRVCVRVRICICVLCLHLYFLHLYFLHLCFAFAFLFCMAFPVRKRVKLEYTRTPRTLMLSCYDAPVCPSVMHPWYFMKKYAVFLTSILWQHISDVLKQNILNICCIKQMNILMMFYEKKMLWLYNIFFHRIYGLFDKYTVQEYTPRIQNFCALFLERGSIKYAILLHHYWFVFHKCLLAEHIYTIEFVFAPEHYEENMLKTVNYWKMLDKGSSA